jgi:hypothetical protein
MISQGNSPTWNHLSDFVHVDFWDAQIAENDFSSPSDTLKFRFIDFVKVVF